MSHQRNLNSHSLTDDLREENPQRQQYPSFMRRCVVDVADSYSANKKGALGRAFGICRSTMNKAGYYDADGNLTREGKKRERHFDRSEDAAYYDNRYEKLLAKHRKKNPEEEGDDYLSVLMSLNR
jgi:hypothetical protein